MTNPAKNLVLSEIKIEAEKVKQVVDLWHSLNEKSANANRCLYVSENDVLEISILNKELSLDKCFHDSPLYEVGEKFRSSLLSDWKRQALTLIDIVKPQSHQLPATPFLQLRHIEVPLRVYNDYIQWRKETIFESVKANENVDSFLAYHSVFSAEPGVTFLSGFSCNSEDYLKGFNTPAYQKIVKDAGNKYICGGEKSLYT